MPTGTPMPAPIAAAWDDEEDDSVEVGVVELVEGGAVAGVLLMVVDTKLEADPWLEDVVALEADACALRYESGTNGLPKAKPVMLALQQSPMLWVVSCIIPQQKEKEAVPRFPQG